MKENLLNVNPFFHPFLIWVEKSFRILLIFALCFNQVAWAMEDPHGGETQVRAVRSSLVQALPIHHTGDEEKSVEGLLEASLLAFTEQERGLGASATLAVTAVRVTPQPQNNAVRVREQESTPASSVVPGPQRLSSSVPVNQLQGDNSLINNEAASVPAARTLPTANTNATSAVETSEAPGLTRGLTSVVLVPGEAPQPHESPSDLAVSLATRHSSRFDIERDEPGDAVDSLETEQLANIEGSWWRNSLRWVNADSLLQKVGYSLALRKNATNDDPVGHQECCSAPVWLSGGSFPIASKKARRYVLFVDGFRQGAEFVIFRTIHTGITVLTYYQLYHYFNQKNPLPCQSASDLGEAGGFFQFMENADSHVLLGVFHDVLGKKNEALSSLRYLLALPFVWGTGKGLWNARNSDLSRGEIGDILEDIAKVKPGVGNDLFRWILPLHPINRNFSMVIKNFLWNPTVSREDLDKIWDSLEILGRRPGYTPIYAMGEMMKIAYGMNARDFRSLKSPNGTRHIQEDEDDLEGVDDYALLQDGPSLSSTLKDRLRIKDQAFAFLQEMADFGNAKKKRTVGGKVQSGMTALYAHYLLWSLGASSSKTSMIATTLFKGGKLYIQGKLVQLIIETFLKAESCPEQPGVSVAGVEPWASDLTQECFDASLRVFNTIPGQPTETLVGNLNQYYFPDCDLGILDLSGRGLSGPAVANITKALLDHNVTFSSLDLSGNSLNSAEDFQAILPYLSGVTVLNLSSNSIGQKAVDQVIAVADMLCQLTRLVSLDLSINSMGFLNPSSGIVYLAQKLQALTNLQVLNISDNNIESKNSNGTVALGKAFLYLTRLVSLDLSDNSIGYRDPNGSIALGYGISALSQLEFLNISNNLIDYTNPDGSAVLAQGISQLTGLKVLDFSVNDLGNTGPVTVLMGSLSGLINLQYLSFSDTNVGMNNGEASALGQSLLFLTNLRNLRLDETSINHNGVQSILPALSKLKELIEFTFLPNAVTNEDVLQINQALKDTLAPPLPSIIASEIDVKSFCESMSGQVINLSGRVSYPNASTINALLECLQSKTGLTSLNLSNNGIGFPDSSASVVLGDGIAVLTGLTELDLSLNNIDFTDSRGTKALGEGLSGLTNLRVLKINGNFIGHADSDGISAVSQGISNLVNLEFLDLSNNPLEFVDSKGLVSLGKALPNLVNLLSFNGSQTKIGYKDSNGALSIAQGLSLLTNLEAINLSTNWIDSKDSRAGVVLGRALANLTNLTYLDLFSNGIGLTDPAGTTAIGNGISSLKKLAFLNLGYNWMGYGGSEGVIALSRSLNRTKEIEYINLMSNPIGSTGPDGPAALVPVLLELPNLPIEKVNVQGMTNVTWTSFAHFLQDLRSEAMLNACQQARCFGRSISSASAPQTLSVASPRLLGASNTTIPFIDNSKSVVIYETLPSQSSFVWDLGTSALTGAALAAVPEAIGDSLYLSGKISAENNNYFKMASNTALVLATGSWIGAGASWGITKGLQYAGVSESRARIVGNTTGFAVNTGLNFTPTGIVLAAVNYGAAVLGLRVEKGIMSLIFPKAQ
jgi:Ran GTPase-activating protein (RanGAP) involved in mRNA processing and transport